MKKKRGIKPSSAAIQNRTAAATLNYFAKVSRARAFQTLYFLPSGNQD